MRDALIFGACLDSREAYEKIRNYVVEGEDLGPIARAWWPYVVDWYGRDPGARAVDRELLRERGKRDFRDGKVQDTLLGWLDDVTESCSPSNVVAELLYLKREQKGLELQQAMSSGADPSKIKTLITEYDRLLTTEQLGTSAVQWTDDDSEMFQLLDTSNRIPLAPEKLNQRCGGGAVPGDHIVLFGRPESGKTLFCVNMTGHFLRTGRRVLYVGNEESTYKTRMRVLTNLLRRTEAEIRAKPEKALEAARRKGYDLLHTVNLTPGSPAEINELIERVHPEVLVIDQIRNIHSGQSKMTQKMEEVAIQVRSLLAKHNLIGLSVTQAGDKTERHGQEVPVILGMADVDSSRTGLPAQADLMVGIGCNEEMRAHGTRMISLPKNKLAGIHEGFVVSVDQQRSVVE